MIRHVVTFALAAETAEQKAADAAWAAEQLESLNGVVPSLISLTCVFDVNRTPGNSDFALISDFADHDALDAYQVHPDHKRVAGSIRGLMSSRAALDYEV